MAYQQLQDLPQEVKEKLPQGAQQIFMAAFNSSSSDGLSEERAYQVAWNSVRTGYEEGNDGKWYRKAEGGAGTNPAGTMPAS